MSRIGIVPVTIPKGVDVKIEGQKVTVKGPKGTLSRTVPPQVSVSLDGGAVHLKGSKEDSQAKALWGLYKVLVANMVDGVVQGYRKNLEIVGVGYKFELKGKDLTVTAGYSRSRQVVCPAGIKFTTEGATKLAIEGIDKELVGQIAADIRGIRGPEPYKGKGIRYAGEHIIRKVGKAAGK